MADIADADVANLALGHLGVGRSIASLNDRSTEARTCNRFYEHARDYAQERYPWKNGLRRVSLALLPENDWDDQFLYAYRIPDDCVWFRRIITGVTNVDAQPSYRIVSDDVGQIVLTDVQNAIAEYSVHVTDPSQWSQAQVAATSYKLAALMVRTFCEDNVDSTRKEMEQLYEIEISRAQALDLNQEEPRDQPPSEFESSRF